jgi:SAM-dependent methyltransferase
MEPDESKILDVGCGSEKHPGAVGLDLRPVDGVDVVHDLRDVPWPLPANHFERVICQDVIEHVPDVAAFLHEIHRVCAPNALVQIRTPHYTSRYAYNDPTHLHAFGYSVLDHFTDGRTTVGGGGRLFRYVRRRLLFSKLHRMMGVSALANRFPFRYEQLFCWSFPCENLWIELAPVR